LSARTILKAEILSDASTLEVGRYIANIVDISLISIYRYRYRIGTLDIGFFYISISYRWQGKYM